MQTTKATAGQRSMERRMLPAESDALAIQFRARPYSTYYISTSELTGKQRNIAHADALYILTVRGYLAAEEVAA